jgi:hypothetical protein
MEIGLEHSAEKSRGSSPIYFSVIELDAQTSERPLMRAGSIDVGSQLQFNLSVKP